MPWKCTHKPRGVPFRKFFAELFAFDNSVATGRVVESAMTSPTVLYMAYEHTSKITGERQVFGAVVQLRYRARASRLNLCYREFAESELPPHHGAPEHILALLTPAKTKAARLWRDSCMENMLKLAESKLAKGAVIEFETPILFDDGHAPTELHIESATEEAVTAQDTMGRVYEIPAEDLFFKIDTKECRVLPRTLH